MRDQAEPAIVYHPEGRDVASLFDRGPGSDHTAFAAAVERSTRRRLTIDIAAAIDQPSEAL